MTGKEPQPRPTILDSEQKLDIENGNDQFTSGKNSDCYSKSEMGK